MDSEQQREQEQVDYYAQASMEKSVYGGASSTPIGMERTPPVRKIVEAQIAHMEKQIQQRKEFLAALDTNPGVEDVLDKMRKLHL